MDLSNFYIYLTVLSGTKYCVLEEVKKIVHVHRCDFPEY
jgi:hypothetical protein